MEFLIENFGNLDIRHVVMWMIGLVLIYLAIKKEMEPTLLLPLSTEAGFKLPARYHGCRLFLHGVGAHYSASDY